MQNLTATSFPSKHMTKSSKQIQFTIGLLFVLLHGQSQTIVRKIKDIKATNVTQVAVDRLGNFFIVSKNNSVQKFNSDGKKTASLKGRNITLLEPWYHHYFFFVFKVSSIAEVSLVSLIVKKDGRVIPGF